MIVRAPNAEQTRQFVDLMYGERIILGDGTAITLKEKTGRRARLLIEAPPSTLVKRELDDKRRLDPADR